MTERVEDGGLRLLDLMASARKLGRGAILRRSFREARTGRSVLSVSAPNSDEWDRSIDTLLCRADRGEFE
jgi:hypothetical protein